MAKKQTNNLVHHVTVATIDNYMCVCNVQTMGRHTVNYVTKQKWTYLLVRKYVRRICPEKDDRFCSLSFIVISELKCVQGSVLI